MYVKITQLVETANLHDCDDRVDLPAGTGGAGSFWVYSVGGNTDDQALDDFAENVPVGCLDDFEIEVVSDDTIHAALMNHIHLGQPVTWDGPQIREWAL